MYKYFPVGHIVPGLWGVVGGGVNHVLFDLGRVHNNLKWQNVNWRGYDFLFFLNDLLKILIICFMRKISKGLLNKTN